MLLLGIHPYLLPRPTICACYLCKEPLRAKSKNPDKKDSWYCYKCDLYFYDAWLTQQRHFRSLRRYHALATTINCDKKDLTREPLRCRQVDCKHVLRISLNHESWTQNAICDGCGQHYSVTNLRDKESTSRQKIVTFISEHFEELIDFAALTRGGLQYAT